MENKIDLSEVLNAWPQDQSDLLTAYKELASAAQKLPESNFSLVSRPGISYSLRANTDHNKVKRDRPIYCLLDVVVSAADPWFLSICFYEDDITDPEERGDAIPGGLFNETGYCFDLDEYDPEAVEYIANRIVEANKSSQASAG